MGRTLHLTAAPVARRAGLHGSHDALSASGSRVDSSRLAADLRSVVRGEVRFDSGSRALYATDGSNYRQPPIGVVIPRDAEDVMAALEMCRRHGAPVFGRGGGTSLAGQCCNAAVCFDFSKYMNRVLEIDARTRLGRVQPGAILDDLRARAAGVGLTFGPDPATHDHCTLGGMVGNDSCGVHSVMAQFAGGGARTADNIEELEVVTYDGVRMRVGATSDVEFERIARGGGRRADIYTRLKSLADRYGDAIRSGFPSIPRRVSGYNLPYLLPERGFNVARALVGSESTCAIVLEVVANLLSNPRARTLVVLGYPDVYQAGDHVPDILPHRPIGLEGIDDRLVADMRTAGIHTKHLGMLPEGKGWLLVEFGGSTHEESDALARQLMAALESAPNAPSMKMFVDRDEEAEIWKIRESGLAATAHVSQSHPTWPGWEDSAVPPDKVGEYLRALRGLMNEFGYTGDLYGHFGQGCIHTRVDFDLMTAGGVERYRRFVDHAADLVIGLGGSLSGEHGDGQARGELLPKMFGREVMEAFREFKSIWDPDWAMNPGKVIDPAPLDANLRLGSSYRPAHPATHFQFPNDSGDFAKATLRCVGVGKCRRLDGGTMCPSFMVTREEEHSTRGRARLLFEMLQGDPLQGGWQDEHVKDALDLCLACKGCKGDCPVGVDMATYKAEFLSHYYEGRRRPVSAYAFGLIHYWARAAAQAPGLVNFVTQTPGLRDLARVAAGMAPQRSIPPFARTTFKEWFRSRPPQPAGRRGRVILWADTFNNHFHPKTAIHAVHALERAGFSVDVPTAALCCGRPLYDYGMLDLAKQWLREILGQLRDPIEDGVALVGLEPSCVSVFRDELRELFPADENARRLSEQSFTLSEFLHSRAVELPQLHRRALVHGHCHHTSILDMDSETELLASMGLDCQLPESGCCGMAGSFGFERDHYDISMRVGERVLLPAVRSVPADTLIVADGFSCRTQIAHATPRRALHLADVIEMAARDGVRGPAGDNPERRYVEQYGGPPSAQTAIAVAGAAVGLGAATWAWAKRRR
ncbi:MAG: FAD-binding and (Fe-S)-binding domain-containing protein [Vicinamibacterales bacterium]